LEFPPFGQMRSGTLIEPTDIAMPARVLGCDGFEVDSLKVLECALAAIRAEDRPLVFIGHRGEDRSRTIRGAIWIKTCAAG
jgi:thiamine pyrophosphate-dependent acetolactate synthase large subunit-like protein